MFVNLGCVSKYQYGNKLKLYDLVNYSNFLTLLQKLLFTYYKKNFIAHNDYDFSIFNE